MERNCKTCKHSIAGDYGGLVCVEPSLLDDGVVLDVSQNNVCSDWKEKEAVR